MLLVTFIMITFLLFHFISLYRKYWVKKCFTLFRWDTICSFLQSHFMFVFVKGTENGSWMTIIFLHMWFMFYMKIQICLFVLFIGELETYIIFLKLFLLLFVLAFVYIIYLWYVTDFVDSVVWKFVLILKYF